MTPKKAHYLLITGLLLTVIAMVGLLYSGRKLLVASSGKVVEAKLNIIKAEKVEETYLKNKQIYLSNEETAQKLDHLIPNDKEQGLAVETIYSFANSAALNITSIVFPGSSLDPVSNQKTKVDISQAIPVKGMTGVYEIPIEINVTGSNGNDIATSQLLTFIESVESSPRNMRITAITYDVNSSNVKLNVSLFVKK